MKVSQGFQVADNRNLAKVDYLMLLEYMQENECFNIAETRSAKVLLASREDYVDTAVGYVEVKREGDICTVKCRVTPEHKVKSKLYEVTAVVNESNEKIVAVECNDCAASAGGCKHAICFSVWLIKRSDEPSVTSTTCYWTKPKLAGAVGDKKVILAKNIGKRKRTLTENMNLNIDLSMFAAECKRRHVTTGMILNYCGNRQSTLNDFSIFNLMLQFVNQQVDHSFENFKSFCHDVITVEVINNVAEATKDQASSKLWHTMRQGRVTGSKIYEAIHCKTENGALVQSILGGYKVPETVAIKRGKTMEILVLKELEKDFGVIESTGFILISPFIGVSPDGMCKEFVIEIKCPMTKKTMVNYIKNHKIQEKFKAQIMLQMHAAEKSEGWFCVADPSFEETKLIHKHLVKYDKDYVKRLLDSAEVFWEQFVFNIIVASVK